MIKFSCVDKKLEFYRVEFGCGVFYFQDRRMMAIILPETTPVVREPPPGVTVWLGGRPMGNPLEQSVYRKNLIAQIHKIFKDIWSVIDYKNTGEFRQYAKEAFNYIIKEALIEQANAKLGLEPSASYPSSSQYTPPDIPKPKRKKLVGV